MLGSQQQLALYSFSSLGAIAYIRPARPRLYLALQDMSYRYGIFLSAKVREYARSGLYWSIDQLPLAVRPPNHFGYTSASSTLCQFRMPVIFADEKTNR